MRAVRWSLPVVLAAAAAVAAPAAALAAATPVRVSARPVTAPLSTRAKRTTVVVKNTGRRRVSGLVVSVASARGVKVALAGAKRGKTSRALPPLGAGRAARLGVSLSRTGRGPQRGRLVVKVTRRGKTLTSTRLAFGPAPARSVPSIPPRTPAPPVNPNSLAGRYFWGSQYTINGIQQFTLYFTGPDLVFTAATESALPTCAAVSDTCKPYSYDARTNQLTIDGKPATLTGRRLEFDSDNYGEFGFPPAGARWDTTVTYSNSSGLCPLYCSYYTENLTFLPDGTFVRDAVSSGSGPIVDWAAVPPDSKGTYEIRADHTLRLAYADGRERIETVANYLNDDGSLKAAGEGILLGGDGYFDIRD
ncbi:hypothetical protein [Conexibacter sp. CPCC 206217]|uniref:hypothetical protein n=1 Tax=Conexibacter sp. CPCC 206217 TaxID=3064574 RepID=UPI00271C0171|nr:hypothetical protein [Conexibacter sp. CPCC 206217]MDO8212616.1 hypothetical protein [Conexibacter sp. CPCC 206217]